MQGSVTPPPSGSVVCWGKLKYSGCHRISSDFANIVLNWMVLRFQGEHCKHCSWCNISVNVSYLFPDDCLIDFSLPGHGRGRAAQLRELTSHTRLAPAIIKGYLLWWEKKRYDGHLFHRNLNEITRSWDFERVSLV